MRISNVLRSITACHNDWSGFLINPRHIRKGHEISWDGRVAGIRKAVIRESDVLDMANKGQYTFQIAEDGSLIQLYYRFSRKTNQVDSARLAFYKAYSDSDSIYNLPAAWMRIDYDPNAKERGIIHHGCHMHLSNFADTRFIVSGIPSPRQFIEFIIASAYPAKYAEHRLELDTTSNDGSRIWRYRNPQQIDNLNRECMPLDEVPIYKQLSHFRVPSNR